MLEIKEANPDQFEEIWPIFKEAAQEADTLVYSPDITKEEAKSLWFAPSAHVYIAYLNGKPVATRHILPNKVGLGSHIANTGVIIDKNYRGQGFGKIMVEFAINKARELGFKAIQLNLVVSTNIASVKNCERYGFRIIGTVPKAFHYKQEKYVDAYIMYKEL